MKCQKCGKDNANTHVKTIINGDYKEYTLCPECGENYLEDGEEICYACRLEHMKNQKNEDSIDSYEDAEDMLPDTMEDSLDAMAELENENDEEEKEAEEEENL